MAIRFSIFTDDAPTTPSVLTFDLEKIVVGRGSVCDLRLPHPSVSFHHATVETGSLRCTIRDEGSTNGTMVNGNRIPASFRQIINSEDVIEIGGFRIIPTLSVPMDGAHSNERVDTVARTLMRDLVKDTEDALIRVVEGPDTGAELVLARGEDRSYTIGTEGDHDLSLDEPELRGRTITIRHGVRGWVLSHEGDGKPEGRRLAHDRTIEVGETMMHFTDPVDAMYQSLLKQREDMDWEPPRTGEEPPGADAPETPSPPAETPVQEPREPDPPVDPAIQSRMETVGRQKEPGHLPEYSWMVVAVGILAFLASLILLLLLMF